MQKGPKRIGEILVEKGLITQAQLHDALVEQKVSDGFLGAILINRGWITKHQLIEGLAEQFDTPLIDIKTQYIDMELARRFSSSLILDHKCFPLRQDENSITVAIVNPLDAVAISKIEDETRPRKLNLVLVDEEDLKGVTQNYRRYVTENIQRLLKKDKKPPKDKKP